MTTQPGFLRRNAVRLTALALLFTLYGFTRLPELPTAERARMAARFAFTREPLPEATGLPRRAIRQVNPSLQRIAAWISSVGAAVALNDLDGDGLPNDVCYVDTRVDQVVVAPVPGTGARYPLFTLDPAPLPFDRKTMAPMGCLPGDLNEDGWTDLLVYYWGRPPVAFLRRAGAGAPGRGAYEPVEIAPPGERWFTNAATRADLDGDGHVDLIIGNYFPDGARILDARTTQPDEMQDTMSRAANGGRKHLLLWQGGTSGEHPTVRFADASAALDEAVAHAWTLGVGTADLDGDLRPEIYFANDFGPDHLLHNLSTPGHLRFRTLTGTKTFTVPSSKVLGRDSFKGMGVDFGDLNGDGRLDIYVSNIADTFALEESHFAFLSTGDVKAMEKGVAPYVDKSEDLGLSRSSWGWETRLDDFDNDGVLEALQATGFVKGEINRWPELHELAMGNDALLRSPRDWPVFQPGDDLSGHPHDPFFVRSASGRYFDLAADLGLGDPHVTRGIATADVDGDGRLDYAIADQWETSWFFHNQSRKAGAALDLALEIPVESMAGTLVLPGTLPGSPRPGTWAWPAIGATAAVRLPDGRLRVAQVDGGNGHSGKRSPEIHLGLGRVAAGTLLPVDLAWRDVHGVAHHQTLRLPPGRHTVLLGEAQGKEG
ncbi:MAG TPA: VCBS repeat-containing protein [Thermoanaerobaculia bacterium]|nr:VCBS repeat-containing protein [Thermoanaerobaculia bacterium]